MRSYKLYEMLSSHVIIYMCNFHFLYMYTKEGFAVLLSTGGFRDFQQAFHDPSLSLATPVPDLETSRESLTWPLKAMQLSAKLTCQPRQTTDRPSTGHWQATDRP